MRRRVGRGRAGDPRPGRPLVVCPACRAASSGSARPIALAHGLIGAAVGFSLWSIVHWTVELPAVAISASALGGTWNRWLAGGTDLFVERGVKDPMPDDGSRRSRSHHAGIHLSPHPGS